MCIKESFDIVYPQKCCKKDSTAYLKHNTSDAVYSLALDRRGHNKQGVSIFAKMHYVGAVNIWGVNRQYGDPNISKLLQLVVNIISIR